MMIKDIIKSLRKQLLIRKLIKNGWYWLECNSETFMLCVPQNHEAATWAALYEVYKEIDGKRYMVPHWAWRMDK